MAWCDLDEYLQQVSSLYPHYHVGEASEDSVGTIRSWVVQVKMKRGEILLKLPEEEEPDRSRAMTIAQLYQSILSFSPQDHDNVELCLHESDGFRIDVGITGAYLKHEEKALVFLACDGSEE